MRPIGGDVPRVTETPERGDGSTQSLCEAIDSTFCADPLSLIALSPSARAPQVDAGTAGSRSRESGEKISETVRAPRVQMQMDPVSLRPGDPAGDPIVQEKRQGPDLIGDSGQSQAPGEDLTERPLPGQRLSAEPMISKSDDTAAEMAAIGVIEFLTGNAYSIAENGKSRRIKAGDQIYARDILTTDYFNVAKGIFRFVTGTIVKKNPDNMTVGLPAGQIAIRGTTVMGEVTGSRSLVVLMPPEGKAEYTGRGGHIVVSNESSGRIVETHIRQQIGYGTIVTADGAAPSLVFKVPEKTIKRLK
ncbi:MAG: hypothetical protein Q8R76_10585, partial [Candidatus Omnitrophota bacterium]|nr:hypothetical protein [Candidatus Omnitrophota bacterium]